MHYRSLILIGALTALAFTLGAAQAFDESKYPDWKGQWARERKGRGARGPKPGVGGGKAPFDPPKPVGLGQQAPLTPEYQARLVESLQDQAEGGQGNWQTVNCFPVGMPGVMTLYRAMELLIMPDTPYVIIPHAG